MSAVPRKPKRTTNAKISQTRSDGDVDVLQVPAVDAHYRPRPRARDRIRAMPAAQQLLVTTDTATAARSPAMQHSGAADLTASR
jgi:hypothetical protein